MVIEENRSYTTVTNSSDSSVYMPWLVGKGTAYGHATNYNTNTTGSAMAYFWLSSGSCHASVNCTLPPNTHDFRCGGDGCFTSSGAVNPIQDDSIFRELDRAGISWKVYAETLPSVGYTGGNSGAYADRHNPAKWYSDVFNGTTAEKNKMVPFTQFATDLANNTLPAYSIIIPNVNDDAHDGTPQTADTWLLNNVNPVLSKSYFQTGGDGLLIITFDNGDNDLAGRVYTAVIGPNVKPGFASGVSYQHQSTLRTLCDALGVAACPGAGGTAAPMSDFFKASTGGAGVVISNPTTTPQITSPVPLNATATSAGLPLTAMKVYLDGNPTEIDTFNGDGSSTTIIGRSAYAMAPGTHTFNVNAWDTGNNIYQSQITFTVASTGVVIGSPGNKSQITGLSPFSATVTSNGLNITAMSAYLDFGTQALTTFNGNGTHQLTGTGSWTFVSGPHTLIVNAWDTAGKVYQSAVNFTVSPTGIVMNAPGNGAQVTNGVPFSAAATSNGPVITAMNVYLDYQSTPLAQFTGNNTASLTENSVLSSIANGNHTLIVNAWDSSGQVYQTAVNITESATGVVVSAPASGAQVSSPVNFSATATSNSTAISAMTVYLDFGTTPLGSFNGNGTSTLTGQTTYTMSSGTHILIVNAWDSVGQIYQTAVPFTVQ